MTTSNSDRHSPGFWMNLLNSFRVAWQLLWDGRVPLSTKIIPVIVVLYILSPIDIIPDFIPGLGQLDDPSAAPDPDRHSSTSGPDQRSSASKDIIDG